VLNHCHQAKAFIHISNSGAYKDNPDPEHRYLETDQLGGMSPHSPYYGVSKVAAEAVVRTLGRIHGVPTTILRLNVAYGAGGSGGLPGLQLEKLIKGETINIAADWPALHVPIHEDDLVDQIEGAVDVAAVETTILNWGGNEVVNLEAWVRYMAALIGVEPNLRRTQEGATWPRALDPTKRDSLIGPCKVGWKAGFRKFVHDRHPEIALKDAP
jgi:nucleoside-diphosphate-sugar epimerase